MDAVGPKHQNAQFVRGAGMQQAVVDFRFLDPVGEIEQQLDDVRMQAEVRPAGAVQDMELLERDAAVRPVARMPTQDRPRHQVVVLIEPILGPERIPLQPRGAGVVEVVGPDLGRDITLTVPGGLHAHLLVFAPQVLLQDIGTKSEEHTSELQSH